MMVTLETTVTRLLILGGEYIISQITGDLQCHQLRALRALPD